VRTQRLILLVAMVLALGYVWLRGGFISKDALRATGDIAPAYSTLIAYAPDGSAVKTGVATFAAGCFWCAEADFEKVPGVISVVSGYTGGRVADPTYEQVSAGGTGHAEAVQVTFDPSRVTYEQLLDHFWHNVDPFVPHRQFCDVGAQYRPEIFVHDEAQRAAAEASKARVQKQFKDPIVVAVSRAGPFYRAEEYHQDYYKKNPLQYRYYRWGCGRDKRLAQIWGNSGS
jgi:peptide-methionine (S)-S-oxide reductase